MANETSGGKWTAARVLEALRLAKGDHYERAKAALGPAWESAIKAWNDAPIGGDRYDWGYPPFTIGSHELEDMATALNRAETPAIADGTSQPWTPPADMAAAIERLMRAAAHHLDLETIERERRHRAEEEAEKLRGERDEARLQLQREQEQGEQARKERNAALQREGKALRERDEAVAKAHAQKWTADRVENDLRAELADYRVALRDSGLWPADEAHDVTPDRIGPRLAALRADRRFELVKAAMAGGRDGYTAVRDADEALGAMGGTKGGGA